MEYHDFLDVFDADLAMSKCPPHRPGYDFELNLVENAKLPPPAKPYHLSQSEGHILKEWIQGMLDTGMITRCTTCCPTAAPVFFVGKKDGSKRPVIDYRRLNDITIRDAYPLPRIDQIMDQVRGSKFFSKFDMKSGYNQLCVKEGQEWLTAFNTPEGPFQLNVMMFGFMNAPPIFQRFVDDHIYKKPELVNHLVGYLDDGNIHNKTMEEHVMKVTFTSIFHPFFLTFSIPLPLRGGKLPTKRPYCGIPGHYGLLGLPGQHSLHGLLGITKTMMSTMTTGLLTHAAIQYASLYSAAFCGRPY